MACIDMDAFFASVEEASNPKLKGRPIAVIGAKERTVVTTCSYAARHLGVKTGMSKFEAKKICPNLILVVGNNRKYTYVSKEIMNYLITITPDVEVYSIDEAFVNLENINVDPESFAYLVKSYIYQRFGITCSIGVGINRFIAKLASTVSKPDGYCFVKKEDIIDFIDNFELKDLWGVGKHLTKKLNNMGIFNTADIRVFGKERLSRLFGKSGEYLYKIACGVYEELANKKNTVKSIGHSITLVENKPSLEICHNYLLQISDMVSQRARKYKLAGKTICLYVRYANFENSMKRCTLPFFTSATHHIYDTSLILFDKIAIPEKNIRQIGVSLSGILEKTVIYSNLFDKKNWEKIYNAVDKINGKFGSSTITYASVLNCERKGALTISPSWKPTGVRNINIK
jgi:DNA polymerase-4